MTSLSYVWHGRVCSGPPSSLASAPCCWNPANAQEYKRRSYNGNGILEYLPSASNENLPSGKKFLTKIFSPSHHMPKWNPQAPCSLYFRPCLYILLSFLLISISPSNKDSNFSPQIRRYPLRYL